jgi:hypothetical protein
MNTDLILSCIFVVWLVCLTLFVMIKIALKNIPNYIKTPDSETSCTPKEFADTYVRPFNFLDTAVDLEGYKLAQPSTFSSTLTSFNRGIVKRKPYIPRYIIKKFNPLKYQRRNRCYNV